jgi:SprT-like protein
MVTLEDLYEEANRFLWDNYNMALVVPIEITDEFVTEEGAYEFTKTAPRRILIAEFVMIFADDDVVYDVLRHELVHYALHLRGRNFADGHPEFEEELSKHGIASTESTMIGVYHLYECAECGGEIPHYEKVSPKDKFVTVCCEAKFVDKNTKAVYTGKERIY